MDHKDPEIESEVDSEIIVRAPTRTPISAAEGAGAEAEAEEVIVAESDAENNLLELVSPVNISSLQEEEVRFSSSLSDASNNPPDENTALLADPRARLRSYSGEPPAENDPVVYGVYPEGE